MLLSLLFMHAALTEFGWQRSEGKLQVKWETAENIAEVNQRVNFILSGCKCKTGCGTKRCKCKKANRSCGPGCQCIHCINGPASMLPMEEEQAFQEDQQPSESGDEYTDTSCDEDEETNDACDVTDIMKAVFDDSGSENEEV